ncbi:MAG: OmpA family protein [Chitinispirillales bacterium]|jgi:outer membrane protein OmpA-like peptidoglycan-associated protein|nr:OmpA family protein [Chitinispirillales bacterium]
MKKTIIILLVALLSVTVFAEQRNRLNELKALESRLDSDFSALRRESVAAATPIYTDAKGRLRAALSILETKPGSKEAATSFSICSTHIAAALIEFGRETNMVQTRRMNATRDSLMLALHNLHEAIGRIEGGRAYRLAQELEATQAKAEELQGDLAAERERLRQVMADAQRRFNELQSELIMVSKDARGTIISMSDILFETGRADLTTNLKTNLARIAGILIVYKEPNIVVEGHTDNVGSRELNQQLSENRASNVLNFLIEQGVEAERMTSVGRAFDVPIADNDTPEGRAKNRRVDLIIQDAMLDSYEAGQAGE